jgi:hypothetical protein
MIIGE